MRNRSQISKVISKFKSDHPSESEKIETEGWSEVLYEGKSLLPSPLNQYTSGYCIPYSLLTLFHFHLNLLKTYHKSLMKPVPSRKFLIDTFRDLSPKDKNMPHFYGKLRTCNIIDKGEYSKTTKNLEDKVRRFALDFDYIIPAHYERQSDWVSDTKEAIKKYGGVVLEWRTASTTGTKDSTKVPVQRDRAKKKKPNVEGKKKKKKEKPEEGHAPFCYGWGLDNNGKHVFKCINSYGRYYKGNGHEEFGSNIHGVLSSIGF